MSTITSNIIINPSGPLNNDQHQFFPNNNQSKEKEVRINKMLPGGLCGHGPLDLLTFAVNF